MEQAEVKSTLGAKLVVPRVQAISRERLGSTLDRLWDHRLGLVVGPAGSGKSTLLSEFAHRVQRPVVWYRADVQDGSAAALLGYLARGAAAAFPGIESDWATGDDAVRALERWTGGPGVLIVDDLHFLEGTPAEECLGRLVLDAPPWLAILVASRRPPQFNLSKLRVSGALLEIGPDDLRFRSWEVEDLFREFYREPMSPEDLAALARRTEGWAAGLQLFHLATHGKPARERQRVIRSLGSGSRLVREYLARNVLDELPAELTTFLLGTCVLGRLTGRLCDRLLERTGSEAILGELERRHVFTAALDDIGTYRYHEVFRSHLEVLFLERHGEAQLKAQYRKAARLLVEEDMLPEALRAYGRAEEWDEAAALLRSRGEEVIEGTTWIEGLPGRLVDHDPWMQLARARRSFATGQWQTAAGEYRKAEAAFESSVGADVCRRERASLAAWLEPLANPPADWSGVLRQATQRDPAVAKARATRMPDQGGQLAAGVAALLAGDLRDARHLLVGVAEAVEASPLLALGARLAASALQPFTGERPDPAELDNLARIGEQLGAPWLAHLARALLALTDRADGLDEAARFRTYCAGNDDGWGGALAAYLEGLGRLRVGSDASDLLDSAATGFRALGAGVLEAWARAAAAVSRARASDPEARQAGLQAEALARAAGARGAQALAFAALGMLAEPSAEEYRLLGKSLSSECGLSLEPLVGGAFVTVAAAAPFDESPVAEVQSNGHEGGVGVAVGHEPPVSLRCLGQFQLRVHGRPVDTSSVKPRARAALHLLALHAPRALHRETMVEALWPGVDPKVGARNLHVVISTLRQLLEPGVARGASSLIVREGETYRFDLPSGTESDVLAFENHIAEGREALAQGDKARAATAFGMTLDLHQGELLSDDGSAEWAAALREQYRSEATAAAQSLAEIELAANNPEAAAIACDRGLRLDRYRDALWRLRIQASDMAGDVAGSARLRKLYDEMLFELGIGS